MATGFEVRRPPGEAAMKALRIALKTLREMLREPALLAITVLFPTLLVVIYASAFGPSAQGMSQVLRVHATVLDTGARGPSGTQWRAGDELVAALRALRFDGKPVFDVRAGEDPATVEIALREQRAAMAIVIPAGFSRALVDARTGPSTVPPPSITMRGDTTSFNFLFAQGFVDSAIRDFARRAAGRPAPPPQRWEFLPGTGTLSDFNVGIPGLLVFGVLFLTITTATLLVREVVNGTLRRLQLSRMRARDLLLGITLAQLVVACVQVPLTLGVASALGFHGRGSILLVALIAMLSALGAVGAGLVVACFARTDGEATNLATGALLPMAFLSGAVFPLPPMPVATVAGHTIQANDLLPTTHATEALRRVLIFGESARGVAFELAATTVLSLLLLALGVVLYQRKRLDGRQ
ncbi:MAG: ABC transporter permease [Deltaproteobacteria bacterium]